MTGARPSDEPRDSAGAPRAGSHDTFTRRITRVTAGLLVLLLIVGASATLALVTAADAVTRLSEGYGPASDANSAGLTSMLDAQNGIRAYAGTGERGFLP